MDRSKAGDRATISLFWKAALRNKRLLILAMLYPLGAIILNTVTPLLIGKTLASLSNPLADPYRYVPWFILSSVLGVLFNRYGFAWMLTHQARTMSYLQSQALQVLLKRSVGFHNNNVGGKLVSDAIDYPSAYSALGNAFFINLLPFVSILVIGSGIIYFESWILGLFITFMAAFALLSGVIESRRRAPLRTRRLKATRDVTGHLADTIVNVQTVKTFANEEGELRHHGKLNKILLDYRLHDWRLAATQGNNRIAVLMVLQLLFILLTVRLVRDNPALLGVGIFAFSFTITLSNRLFEINSMIRSIEDGFLQASPMAEILHQEPEILDAVDAQPLKVKKGAINMQDVSFKYDESTAKQHVFSKLNIAIAPGEKIGLVGPSGGGKSTFTRLLLRFEDINGGVIAIDDQDISKVTQSSLREVISYVPQEPLLFHRTIRENIAYGNWEASDEDITNAAKSAHADIFIKGLPEGYDTIVGERGVKLSGGQRQRIAIARAVLKNAPILILDEATSALDSESEVLIQKALWDLMKDRTAIVIAHRLSTIQKMDRIVVLDDGKIIEEGTHKQLLTHKGMYAKLWAHQSGGFIED